MRMPRSVVVPFVVLTLALEACAIQPVSPTSQASPDARFDLHVDNGTTVQISVVLDGREASQVAPRTTTVVSLRNEPIGDVTIEARIPNGRPVITFAIDPRVLGAAPVGSVTNVTGAAHRVDLSCGRLDIWLLTPPLGPAPGPGTPGDCGPPGS
jgi:hypothetical protein